MVWNGLYIDSKILYIRLHTVNFEEIYILAIRIKKKRKQNYNEEKMIGCNFFYLIMPSWPREKMIINWSSEKQLVVTSKILPRHLVANKVLSSWHWLRHIQSNLFLLLIWRLWAAWIVYQLHSRDINTLQQLLNLSRPEKHEISRISRNRILTANYPFDLQSEGNIFS